MTPKYNGERRRGAGESRRQKATQETCIFFINPGHETYSVYHDEHVLKVIANGIRWANQKHTDGRILENWQRKEPLHERSK